MTTRELEASTRVDAGVAVIDLHGEINRSSEAVLGAAYADAAAGDAGTVLLNFADVAYINSTGIAVIVGFLGRARSDGRRVIACALSDHYREIFEITRLSDFMPIYDDEANAVAERTG
ncbi:MAG TPA: STAS domain-containing protein [Actinomycetota bacterium]|nr:STAS domain-containing protein [Actinomycetota bacterium]